MIDGNQISAFLDSLVAGWCGGDLGGAVLICGFFIDELRFAPAV